MAFADRYLQKHALGTELFEIEPDPEVTCIITIPAYKESRLTDCLDSLFSCDPSERKSEVLVLINEPEGVEQDVYRCNLEAFREASDWIASHARKDLFFHVTYVKNLSKKHFGAGLARKLVMDEAIRRFNTINQKDGIVLSLDADTKVARNYIKAVSEHFIKNPEASGCAIRFQHPVKGNEFSKEIYAAARNYEAHLNYYVEAVRSTGYPFVFHTIGSCFAVRASVYCAQGGMNKRQAGEDFYFIQKVAMQGNFTECNSTTVYPSPRPSDRVPFGTGPEIQKQLINPGQPFLTYAPVLFQHLKTFYEQGPTLFDSEDNSSFIAKMHPILKNYLEINHFQQLTEEILQNVSTRESFHKRFLRKFNMFWILKYLHYAESKGIAKVPLDEAVRDLKIKR